MSCLICSRERCFALADDEERQPLGTGDEAVGLVGLDHGEVEALHLLTVELAAALDHHEHLGVRVAVRGCFESRWHLHHLRVPAAVALGEEAPARAQLARGLRGLWVGAGRDRNVPFGLFEVIDAAVQLISCSLTRRPGYPAS